MRQNKDSSEKKACTKCLAKLPIEAFHRKGDRTHAACKDCRNELRRSKYKTVGEKQAKHQLQKFADQAVDIEIKILDDFNRRAKALLNQIEA